MAGTRTWQWKLLHSLHSVHLPEEMAKIPMLTKRNDFTSTEVLSEDFINSEKEQNSKSTNPMILIIVLELN